MKIKRSRTISHVLLAMVASASALGMALPASIQAQDLNEIIVCKPIERTGTQLFCVLCEESIWFRIFYWTACAACTKPFAPK